MKVKIERIEELFKEIFDTEEGIVQSVETLYETPDNGDFLKLIISIHGLSTEDSNIIHTKFIFKSNKDKTHLISNSFIYLYDINCVYHQIEFDGDSDLKSKIEHIVKTNNFGKNIIILSDFIDSPAMFLNFYLKKSNITEYSVFDVEYTPKFKTTPCQSTTFDFKIDINNNYKFDLSISKIEPDDKTESPKYKFQFKLMDYIKTIEEPTLKNIHYTIGANIADILDKKLKS